MSQTWPDKGVVVVGLDETPASRRAALWAAREAARRGAVLEVITTWMFDALDAAPAVAVDPALLRESAEQIQAEALAEVLALVEERPAVRTRVLQCSAADALVDASTRADLVVVGTHGRGPVRAMLLGSVSQAVVRHAACPVVVMPPLHHAAGDEAAQDRGTAAPS